MSHYSRIRTEFRHKEALICCLQQQGFVVETDSVISGHRGQHTVDIAAKNARGYGIGFVKNSDGTYDMIADWWGVKGAGEKKIADELQRQAGRIQAEYAKAVVLEQVKKEGFDVVSQTDETDGTTRIVVRRWV